ncbi:hypothetical protein ACLMJK_002086 [Lecanora helva]
MGKKRDYEHSGNTDNDVKPRKKHKSDANSFHVNGNVGENERPSPNNTAHVSQRQNQSPATAPVSSDGSILSKALNFATSPSSTSNGPSKNTKSAPPYQGNIGTLPLLPPILDEEIATVPFTHQGFHHGSIASNVHRSYERFEFIGDAYIELIATRLVVKLFPNLPAGRLSQKRELCVKNETLAQYATQYGFPDRARLPQNFNWNDRKVRTKTMGDIFEAYVAAVIISDPENGFQTVEAWLTTLWEYELLSKEQQSSKVEAQDVKIDSKNSLMKAVGGRYVKLDYRRCAPPESVRDQGKVIFHIGVYLRGWLWTDQHLGSGSGLSVQEAGQMAAAEALKNPLLSEITRVKKEYDALVAAARERGEEPPPFRE